MHSFLIYKPNFCSSDKLNRQVLAKDKVYCNSQTYKAVWGIKSSSGCSAITIWILVDQ